MLGNYNPLIVTAPGSDALAARDNAALAATAANFRQKLADLLFMASGY